jgi:two-component system chemotaxis response regulator CheB
MNLSSPRAPVKVLIVDDSAFMRAALSRMVASDDSLRVVGTAESGLEALVKISALHPDVVTLDLDMPGLDGLETLKRIMSESPRPVVVVSALARHGAEDAVQALAVGACDCIAKQLNYDYLDVVKIQEELVAKIKAAAGCPAPAPCPSRHLDGPATRPAPASAATVPGIVAIGTSTGGPQALQKVLSALPADLPVPIVVVQHMPVGFIEPFAKRLNDLGPLRVHEAQENEIIRAGHAYLAQAGMHLIVQRQSSSGVVLRLSLLPSDLPHKPSVDVLMSSVAEVFGSSSMGIILTGMGDDGALGMQAIFQAGGVTVVQDQATCVVYGMPRACAALGVLNQVAPLPDIPRHILAALRYRTRAATTR